MLTSGGAGMKLVAVKCRIQSGAILLVLLSLTGCASTGLIQHASPIATGTPVSIDFALVETSSTPGNLEAEHRLLNELIVSDLRASGVFSEVDGGPASIGASNGIKIKVVIREINKISQGQREWAGALAGRARILAEATVSDLSSGRLIETFEAAGVSSGGSNYSGTTDEAIQRAAEQVVAQVIKISSQTGP
jgi:Domain of unknown function (DUF4410)